MLSGFCGDKPSKFSHLWHSAGLWISRFWRYMLLPCSRPPLKMETVYCTYKNCTVSQPTISHSDAAFFSPSVATRCFCWHYEIFRSNIHTSYADTHWQLIRLRYSYTHVSYYEEVTVSADLYGCEIWTVEEIDKKINWVHEIRFVKYCYGERILDAAKILEET